MPAPPLLSVIIPCLKDAAALAECLTRLESAGADCEIIVADASDDDACLRIAHQAGATALHCARQGRGPQLNAGAAVARGEILVFNHCDTLLQAEHLAALRRAAEETHPPFRCGAFFKDLAWHYPKCAWADSTIREWTRNFGTLYGDQTLFFRRGHFQRLGGFASIPIMEDVEMSRRMRRGGGLLLLDPPLRTSMRRFQRRGYLKNRLQNLTLLGLYHLGFASPERIYRWYYQRRTPA